VTRRTTSRVSVALCTYQGERYLSEQLASIAGQSRPPDELVVSDDASTDGTLQILQDFRGPFSVEIHRNAERLGYAKNFERAISLCRGAVVCLSDQERMVGAFDTSPELAAAFTDAHLIDEASGIVPGSLWRSLGIGPRWRRRFSTGGPGVRARLLSQRNAAAGATLAFREDLRELILPIPEGWVHDAWIVLLISAVAEVRMMPEPLIRYRVHSAQQIGLGRGGGRLARWRTAAGASGAGPERGPEAFIRQAELIALAHARLRERGTAYPPSPEALSALASCERHLRRRAEIQGARGPWTMVVGELAAGRYHRHSSGLASAARDLLSPGER
jgi:glycosyltransferase involved in cell wall biosynthesis